jgi:thiamine biosynthesis lipoprotein
MGTIVTIDAPIGEADQEQIIHTEQAIDRAFQWFSSVEERCTRFNLQSELMQLTAQPGVAVPVSEILYEAVQFAVAVADESGGAFDPAIGHAMEVRGFNREYTTGDIVRSPLAADSPATYRDVVLDPDRKTIMLLRPLILDLGAVAKGLAIDLAARELRQLKNFSIDAGGDLYLGGSNSKGEPWAVGIRHPRRDHEVIDVIYVSDRAVCTSGDYERRVDSDETDQHHILDPRAGASPKAVASATVVAETAMLADAAATAAFVLGPVEGIQFLDRLGLDGLIISPELERHATRGMRSEYKLGTSTIL